MARYIWTDEQRQEILRPHDLGMTAATIARVCAHGSGGLDPFPIPRRTVSDIIRKAPKREQGRSARASDPTRTSSALNREPCCSEPTFVHDDAKRLHCARCGHEPGIFERVAILEQIQPFATMSVS